MKIIFVLEPYKTVVRKIHCKPVLLSLKSALILTVSDYKKRHLSPFVHPSPNFLYTVILWKSGIKSLSIYFLSVCSGTVLGAVKDICVTLDP